MYSGDAGRDTQSRPQSPPPATAAAPLYSNNAAREYTLPHHITLAARKPADVNTLNAPFTPAMILWQARGQQHSLQTIKTLSHPISLNPARI